MPYQPFSQAVQTWTDFDITAYQLALCLGLLQPDTTFLAAKHIFWTDNPLGNILHNLLKTLVQFGVLEVNEEEQFRWNTDFELQQ